MKRVKWKVTSSSRHKKPDADRRCKHCGAMKTPYVPSCHRCGRKMANAKPHRLEERPASYTRIGHLTDIHLGARRKGISRLYQFQCWLEVMARADVDGVVISGDLIEIPGDSKALEVGFSALSRSGLDYWIVPGNHDVGIEDRNEPFFDIFGGYPRVEHCGEVELILFDSMRGLRKADRAVKEKAFNFFFMWTEGAVGNDQFESADKLLPEPTERSRLVVIHHHIHPQPPDRIFANFDNDLIGTMKPLMDGRNMINWARQNGAATILHGHKHKYMQPGATDGVLVLNGGSSTEHSGKRNRARIIDFGANDSRVIHEIELR